MDPWLLRGCFVHITMCFKFFVFFFFAQQLCFNVLIFSETHILGFLVGNQPCRNNHVLGAFGNFLAAVQDYVMQKRIKLRGVKRG